ncbi:GNAT family N-acetyltransferase [uncultured Pseudomonas sp.]|uniref:GNAT family N-acetyltransferase n=1 Tax=uncultured Pseudomonas sp. TaxID=114707 RepID=UPI0025EEF680|nr:GNAT family N-acetyltransferase [uncultured Pseudomonas sp.]
MPEISIERLPDASRPLLDKFYRSHRSPMRLPAGGQAWVARQAQIIGALCLTPVDHGHWLTGLFVAPAWQGQGVAGCLIDGAQAGQPGPLWLFCHPSLTAFYARRGFTLAPELPARLRERLARYQQHKALLAMLRVSHPPVDQARETTLR